MNKLMSMASFGIGAVTGGILAYIFVMRRAERHIDEQLEAAKSYYEEKNNEPTIIFKKDEEKKSEKVPTEKSSFMASYKNVADQYDYTKATKNEEKQKETVEYEIYPISFNDYNKTVYDSEELHYLSMDHVLINSDMHIVDFEDTIGKDYIQDLESGIYCYFCNRTTGKVYKVETIDDVSFTEYGES